MFELFESYLKEKADLTEEELEIIQKASIKKKLRRRQYLLQEGDVCSFNCFVEKGCLRLYRLSEDGTEHILRFAVENWWISDTESYNTGQPSKNNIEALEDCELIMIDISHFSELTRTVPKFRDFIERLKAKSFDASQNRILSNISYSAEEKYQEFIKAFPDILFRVPLHMVASYLGISRETLSRIRHAYAHRN